MKAGNSLENEFCATVPLIFRLHPDADFSKNDSSLHLAADALRNRFKKDPARIEQGRAHRAAPPDLELGLSSLVQSIWGTQPGKVVPEDKILPDLKTSLKKTVFAVAKGHSTRSAETGHLASLRLGVVGTRQLIVARTMQVVEFLQKSAPSQKTDLSSVHGYIKNIKFGEVRGVTLHYATVGPNDALYSPAG